METEMRARTTTLVLTVLLAARPACSQPVDAVPFVGAQLLVVGWGQYMAHNCWPTAVLGWELYPVQLCRYASSYGPVPVALLNPDNGRLARWLVSGCQDAGAQYLKHCAERLALRIKCQSGNQFPVAGFVDEGPLYTFRDGVTVTFSEIGINRLNQLPTPAQEASVLGQGTVSKVHKFARIQGTTREEYAGFTGKPVGQFAGLAWRTTIRAAYQAAWASDRNTLLSAWARANRWSIDHKLAPAARFDSYCKSVAANWAPWPITGE
jgi:hypothetical protein